MSLLAANASLSPISLTGRSTTQPDPRHIIETSNGFVIMNRRIEEMMNRPVPDLIRLGVSLNLDAALIGDCCGIRLADGHLPRTGQIPE